MILLDTNVLSALMRDVPDPAVVAWLDGEDAGQIWTTAVTVFEIRHGLARLAAGRKRARLEAAFDGLIAGELAGRIAPVDRDAADAAGRLAARREAAGWNVDFRDTLIAGVALSRRAVIATRNIRHFDDVSPAPLDPWTVQASCMP